MTIMLTTLYLQAKYVLFPASVCQRCYATIVMKQRPREKKLDVLLQTIGPAATSAVAVSVHANWYIYMNEISFSFVFSIFNLSFL